MKITYDFIINALPWIAMGLFLAFSVVSVRAKKEEKELKKFFVWASWLPAILFICVASLNLKSGKKSDATVWFIIGLFNVITIFSSSHSDEEDGNEDKMSSGDGGSGSKGD